jgi:hypothetical protein
MFAQTLKRFCGVITFSLITFLAAAPLSVAQDAEFQKLQAVLKKIEADSNARDEKVGGDCISA